MPRSWTPLEPPLLLDVRSDAEWQEQHIADSLNIPLNRLAERADEVAGDRAVVVHCSSGYRSSIAVSVLRKHGHKHVVDLVGGVGGWEASETRDRISRRLTGVRRPRRTRDGLRAGNGPGY